MEASLSSCVQPQGEGSQRRENERGKAYISIHSVSIHSVRQQQLNHRGMAIERGGPQRCPTLYAAEVERHGMTHDNKQRVQQEVQRKKVLQVAVH